MCYKQKCKVLSLNLAHPVGVLDVGYVNSRTNLTTIFSNKNMAR